MLSPSLRFLVLFLLPLLANSFSVLPTASTGGFLASSVSERSSSSAYLRRRPLSPPTLLSLSGSSSSSTTLRAAASTCSSSVLPGTATLDKPWTDLGFEFRPTKSHLRMTFKEGKGWGPMELVKDPYVNIHIAATALHYGQACFEGLKAFTHADNSVHLFRPYDNAARIQASCKRVMMPELPAETFVEACRLVARDNIAYVPPHGSNGALYLRPVLFGSGPRIGLQPADEYTFLIMVIPVGDYYKGGLAPVPAVVISDFDRAAPRGVGGVKVAGNYAADLLPNMLGKKKGYPIGLYLDSKTNSFIEEFSTSNFVGFKDGGATLVTPKSDSVLPSITNKSLMQLARDEGMKVEQREVPVTELAELEEVVACGTAVVVTPIGKILVGDKVYSFGQDVGKTTMKLYNRVRRIQNGEEPDKFGWNVKV